MLILLQLRRLPQRARFLGIFSHQGLDRAAPISNSTYVKSQYNWKAIDCQGCGHSLYHLIHGVNLHSLKRRFSVSYLLIDRSSACSEMSAVYKLRLVCNVSNGRESRYAG